MRGSARHLLAAALLFGAAWIFTVPASAAAAAPCGAATSSSGEWPVYGHDAANTRSQPAEHALGPAQAGSLSAAWSFSTASVGDAAGFQSTPVVDRGCVFLGSTNAVMYALNASDGKLMWHRQLPLTTAGFGGGIVGAPLVSGSRVFVLVDEANSPYVAALDRTTGALLWKSAPIVSGNGYYTNASPVLANGLIVAGYSPAEGDPAATGGFALIDPATGSIEKVTPTIPPADQAQGFAGGGLWSTPAYDPATKYLYWGAGNPSSKQKQHPNTDAILKIDLSRSRATFGQVVAASPGNVDQYTDTLKTLSGNPVCAASDNPSVPYPLDDPACGQLDLDFGASANLFTDSHGTEIVGDLQKSGVYHAANADTMKPAWSRIVGVSCQVCNAASTAFDGRSIDGVGAPGGELFSLARDDGTPNWLSPIGDGAHYQSVSTADGVVYTTDGNGFLDVIDAATGDTITRIPMTVDAGAPATGLTSNGVSIAEHTVFASASELPTATGGATAGLIVAYRPG
jgi:polyvinyl alcohol dehydrogenase (cytochrome)